MDTLDILANTRNLVVADHPRRRHSRSGSPRVAGRDDGGGITPHRPDDALRDALAGADADVVIAGHTHQPTDRTVGEIRALNGGSVSNPVTDDVRASYTIIRSDRHGHDVEHRRVANDHGDFLDRLAQSSRPRREYSSSFQRGEQGRYVADRPGAPTIVA